MRYRGEENKYRLEITNDDGINNTTGNGGSEHIIIDGLQISILGASGFDDGIDNDYSNITISNNIIKDAGLGADRNGINSDNSSNTNIKTFPIYILI